jgi:hypothetical protein
VSSVGKVEHAPESGIGIGLGYLEQGEVWRVRRRKGELVDGRDYASVGYGPLEVAGGLAANDAGCSTVPRAMAWIRG